MAVDLIDWKRSQTCDRKPRCLQHGTAPPSFKIPYSHPPHAIGRHHCSLLAPQSLAHGPETQACTDTEESVEPIGQDCKTRRCRSPSMRGTEAALVAGACNSPQLNSSSSGSLILSDKIRNCATTNAITKQQSQITEDDRSSRPLHPQRPECPSSDNLFTAMPGSEKPDTFNPSAASTAARLCAQSGTAAHDHSRSRSPAAPPTRPRDC